MKTPFPTPVEHFDRDTVAIEALRQTPPGLARVPGLTIAQYGLQREIGFSASGVPRGRVCLWVDELEVQFAYLKVDIFVSKDYPDGTCEKMYIGRHEQDHVDVHRRLHERYAGLMTEALIGAPGLPTRGNPAYFENEDAGKKIIEDAIDKITAPIYKAFEEELAVEQARLDTPSPTAPFRGFARVAISRRPPAALFSVPEISWHGRRCQACRARSDRIPSHGLAPYFLARLAIAMARYFSASGLPGSRRRASPTPLHDAPIPIPIKHRDVEMRLGQGREGQGGPVMVLGGGSVPAALGHHALMQAPFGSAPAQLSL